MVDRRAKKRRDTPSKHFHFSLEWEIYRDLLGIIREQLIREKRTNRLIKTPTGFIRIATIEKVERCLDMARKRVKGKRGIDA